MKSFNNVREKVKRLGHFTFTIAARSCLDTLDWHGKNCNFSLLYIFWCTMRKYLQWLSVFWDRIYSGCQYFEIVFTALWESIYSGFLTLRKYLQWLPVFWYSIYSPLRKYLQWLPELKHHGPTVPILLVGTQADLRGGTVGDKLKTKEKSGMQIPRK